MSPEIATLLTLSAATVKSEFNPDAMPGFPAKLGPRHSVEQVFLYMYSTHEIV